MKSATTKSAAAIMLISFQLAAIAANDPLTQQEKHNRDETARSLAIELAARDTVAIKSLVQDQSGKYQVTLERIGPKGAQKCVLNILVNEEKLAPGAVRQDPELSAVHCTNIDTFHPAKSLLDN